VRLVKPYVTTHTLKVIYYSYFHCIMTYGLIFWGNSPDSIKIFRLWKKIIRIMMGCRSRDSCRKLFLNLEILPLLLFMIRNKNQFQVNSEIHQINPLMPNDDCSGRTAPLTSKCCILYIYSTNIGIEYFKCGVYSPFSPLQNAVCFINLTYFVPVLFTFYIEVC